MNPWQTIMTAWRDGQIDDLECDRRLREYYEALAAREAAVPGGAVKVYMVCGGECNGVHLLPDDGEPIEWSPNGYDLIPRQPEQAAP